MSNPVSDTPRTDRYIEDGADLAGLCVSLELELTAEKQRSERLEKELAAYRDYRASLIAEGRFNALYELEAALGDSNG